ncbi:hypothetical protein MMC26_000865 [Xylographa opegraphella]|nr:hypothetical protein [Xylographa opegraphella]
MATDRTKPSALKKENRTPEGKERGTTAMSKYVVFDPNKPSWCWHKPPWIPFRFLDLPFDIRRQVYIELEWCELKTIQKGRPGDPILQSGSIDRFARVNHQVRDEIQSIIRMQGFRLMDLPYDIRGQIYLYLAAGDPELVILRLRPKIERIKYAAQHVDRSTDHLVRVNRHIRDEVLSMYYRRKLFTIQMSGTKAHGRCVCGCQLRQCTLVMVYRYWRPNTPLVRQCEFTIDLPLELDEFRIVSRLLTSANAKVQRSFHSDYHDLTARQRGLVRPVQQIKIRIVSGGTRHRFKPAGRNDIWDWRDFRRESWGPSGGNAFEEANDFSTEQALISTLGQLFQQDSAKKGR